MEYYVYILQSERDHKKYIGSTSNVQKRLVAHNAGKNISTKYRVPLRLIYVQKFSDKTSALIYERWLKKQKGGVTIKKLIEDQINIRP